MACMRSTVASPNISTDDNRVGRSRTDFASLTFTSHSWALIPHRASALTAITFRTHNLYAEVCYIHDQKALAQIDVKWACEFPLSKGLVNKSARLFSIHTEAHNPLNFNVDSRGN